MCTGIDWRLLIPVLAFGLAGCNMSTTLLKEKPSPYAFDATVTAITEKALAQGWEVMPLKVTKSDLAHALDCLGLTSPFKVISSCCKI